MIAGNIILCPLSPSTPLSESIRDEDPAWAELGDAPIRVDEQSAVQASREAGADDVVDGVDEEEAQMPRGLPAPPEPSTADIAKHNLTHFPYRSWCPHCVSCRRPNAPHRSHRSSRRMVPLFCADYCFVKDSLDSSMATVLAGRLYPSNAVFATVCDAKGTEDTHAVARLTNFIKESGVPKLVYKSD